MSLPEETIAFIGLGVMGYPMAVNLRKKMPRAHTLLICDISAAAIQRFRHEMADTGVIDTVQNAAEAIQRADTVITMLPDSSAVQSVYLSGPSNLLTVQPSSLPNPSKKLLMECGTIETDTILAVNKAVLSSGLGTFVDAPVSGGPMGAHDGTLCFMVGCEESISASGASVTTDSTPERDVFPRVKSILSHMGRSDSIFQCGPVGSGTAFKIINNYLSAITSLAASEALNIGTKMGLDPRRLTDVINASGGQCWVTSKSNPVPGVQANAPASRNYEGGFRIELCKKVLGMGSRLAEMVGAKTFLDRPTLDTMDKCAADDRYRGKDARVLYKFLNDM